MAKDLRAIDIWIGDETDLGKGYGTKMMELALACCFASPTVSAVLVGPLVGNVRVHRFHERLGFRFVERRYFGEDERFVYRLDQQQAEPERQKLRSWVPAPRRVAWPS